MLIAEDSYTFEENLHLLKVFGVIFFIADKSIDFCIGR